MTGASIAQESGPASRHGPGSVMFFFSGGEVFLRSFFRKFRKDCFTGQSPGLGKALRRWPSPSQSSSRGDWQAAGAGSVEGCLGEHLAKRRFVSLHV